MSVFALITPIGMGIGVRILVVEVDKNGMEDSVSVLMVSILTEQSASFASMDKFGMSSAWNVSVRPDIDGMAIFVRNLSFALGVECTIQLLINVFVQSVNFGMGLLVWFNPNVMAGKNGI